MARWGLAAAQCVLVMALAVASHGARADTAIRLLQSHVGNVNFVGTQETIRDKGNNQPCRVYSPTVYRYAELKGIPAEAEILSAQLYWAGSGYYPDFNVVMDGWAISAPSDRRYYSTTIGNNYNYFSGAADVTAQVKLKRNAVYAFRGLTVDYNSPYCAVEGVLGGFSLLVIYADENQPFRMLNLYEGFQYMRYNGFTLNLSGFRVPDPIGTATGRVAHITWEGDSTLDGYGENLKFNGYEMTDSRNPSGNQFNSKSNINGDDKSFGIDFDAYTVGHPVIKSGQTTASTRYESGQDLVLLSAEVVALPNVPLSDLAISLQVPAKMIVGRDAALTITVSNKGPSTANGPTVVTSTLPPGLSFVSGAGTGWSCSAVAQNVSCSHQGTVPAGDALPVLIVTAKVTKSGAIPVSASVSGKMYDPQLGNNSASGQGTAAVGESRYVFTDTACAKTKKVGETGQCSDQLAPGAAGVPRKIFITAVDTDDVPILPASQDGNMFFALKCINPAKTADVIATIQGSSLRSCAAADAEPEDSVSSVAVQFKGYSADVEFIYADVGKVELYMRPVDSASVSVSTEFVSYPYELRIANVMRGGKDIVPAVLDDTDAFVMRSGLSFTATVMSLAYTKDGAGVVTRNFGKEEPTAAAFGTPVISSGTSAALTLPALEATFSGIEKGTATGTFSWHDVGIISLTPQLKADNYFGVTHASIVLTPAKAGRFIPHHFETTVVGKLTCLDRMVCAIDADTAAYSREPFDVIITARSSNGTQTKNYEVGFAKEVRLVSVASAGGELKDGLSDTKAAASEFFDGVATVKPHYELPNGFVHTAPQAVWGSPESVYVRASDTDSVTSLQGPADSLEGGLRIVNGRLLVPNAHGSERLGLPLKVSAQYWTGANWELSSKDMHSPVDSTKAAFSNSGALSLSISPAGSQLLKNGSIGFSVKATPAVSGSADLIINGQEWLPSTKGRLKFGTYKSPLIYLRERH